MVTRCGIVTEINAANRVKRDTCSKNFRRVLKRIERVFKKMYLNGVWREAVRHSKIPHQFSIAQQNAKGFLLYRAFVHPIKNRRLHKISERWMVQIFDSIFK